MKSLRAMLGDRRRSQRGSVLSAVLIMTAFLAIISAALMTELSTNLLVSRTLVHRVSNEASVNSAVELTIDRLLGTLVGQPCPPTNSFAINQVTASAFYASCGLSHDPSSPIAVAGSSPFTVDGTHVVINSSGWNVNEYLVGDSSSLYAFDFGSATPNWPPYDVGGPLTGPPAAMRDTRGSAPDLLDLVPTAAGCGGPPDCVQVLTESGGPPAPLGCALAAGAAVTARPEAGIRNNTVVYFGDSAGTLYSYTPGTAGDADCIQNDTQAAGRPIVAGPFVFRGPSGGVDEIYVITSNGSTSQLLRFTYSSGSGQLTGPISTLNLRNEPVVGAAIDGTTLPAHIAITYSTGDVSLEQINSNFSTADLGHRSVTNSIAAAPSWCQCPGGNLFGVGGTNGNLYVLDMGVNLHASYNGGPSITTAPSADAAGDWFFGASDAYLHEVVQLPGQPAMVQADAIGPLDGAAGSSAIAGPCRSGLLCVYVATNQSTAYLTIFDRHTALINACIISSPSTCSGDNPRLWASLDIGATGTVRVTGWSYYSP